MEKNIKKIFGCIIFVSLILGSAGCAVDRQVRRQEELDKMQKEFSWWPTDAKPAPVKDQERGGYWWWPKEQGTATTLWGNRGYVYLYKIIYDYKEEELSPAKPREMRPSLLIRKILKNIKIYFDYDKANLRSDVQKILKNAVGTLNRNPDASILVTGNCDTRGSEAYNEKLGRRRAEAVQKFLLDEGVDEKRIKIISRGKLDAVAPVKDIAGMQKDRNAQFMIAEVEEIMIPAPDKEELSEAKKIEEGKYIIEKEEQIESKPKVSQEEYVVQKGDTLSKIALKKLGKAHRWKYLYEINKDRIKNPNKLKVGKKIIIPLE